MNDTPSYMLNIPRFRMLIDDRNEIISIPSSLEACQSREEERFSLWKDVV